MREKRGEDMAAHLLAIANMKGGVGKTTTVVTLAETLAAGGKRILVIDLDAQTNATLSLVGDTKASEIINAYKTMTEYVDSRLILQESVVLGDFIAKDVSQTTYEDARLEIDLIGAAPGLRMAERELIYELTERKFNMRAIEAQVNKELSKDIAAFRLLYDYVIFDCPPGISALTEVAIRASDLVVVPTVPDYVSFAGLEVFLRSFWNDKRTALPTPPRLPHVLFTRVAQSRHQKDMLKLISDRGSGEDKPFEILQTRITLLNSIAEGLGKGGEPVTLQSRWGDDAVSLFDELADEIDGILNA